MWHLKQHWDVVGSLLEICSSAEINGVWCLGDALQPFDIPVNRNLSLFTIPIINEMKHSCNQYLGMLCNRTQDSLADFLVAEEAVATQKPIPSGAAVGGLCEGPALRYVSAGTIEIVFRNDLPSLLRVFILDGF